MSTYEYMDSIGDKLRISSNGYGGATLVAEGKSSLRRKTILVEHEDAPTVAAELLKAAGQESVIVPKNSLAVATHHPESTTDTWVTHESCGPLSEADYSVVDSSNAWLMARHWISIALKVEQVEGEAESVKAEAEAAETKLQERRDALTQEFSTYPYRYDNVSPTARKAIDRIIELEDAAK